MGQSDKAVALFEDARRLYAAAGDRAGVARALNNLGSALSDGPQRARVKALYDEGLQIARAVGDQDLVARLLNNTAVQERRAGNLETALRMNQESLSIRKEIGDRTNAAISLNNIGNLLLDMGDPQAASEHYEQSAAMSREIGIAGARRARGTMRGSPSWSRGIRPGARQHRGRVETAPQHRRPGKRRNVAVWPRLGRFNAG